MSSSENRCWLQCTRLGLEEGGKYVESHHNRHRLCSAVPYLKISFAAIANRQRKTLVLQELVPVGNTAYLALLHVADVAEKSAIIAMQVKWSTARIMMKMSTATARQRISWWMMGYDWRPSMFSGRWGMTDGRWGTTDGRRITIGERWSMYRF